MDLGKIELPQVTKYVSFSLDKKDLVILKLIKIEGLLMELIEILKKENDDTTSI